MRRNKENSQQLERAISAPAVIQRIRSAGPGRPHFRENPHKLQLSKTTQANKDTSGVFLKTKLSAWEKKDGSRPSTSILKR